MGEPLFIGGMVAVGPLLAGWQTTAFSWRWAFGFNVLLGILIFILHDGGPATFWVLGLLMTVFVGPAQAASRSFLGTPSSRA